MDESSLPAGRGVNPYEYAREFAELVHTTLKTSLSDKVVEKIRGLFSRFLFWPDALNQIATVAFLECAAERKGDEPLTEDDVLRIVDRVRKSFANEAKRIRSGELVEVAAARTLPPDVEAEYSEILESLREFVNTLKPPESLLFTLRYVENASLREIADQTGMPISTVSRRLKQVKAAFISRHRHQIAPPTPD